MQTINVGDYEWISGYRHFIYQPNQYSDEFEMYDRLKTSYMLVRTMIGSDLFQAKSILVVDVLKITNPTKNA